MTKPKLVVIAGCNGSGKSTHSHTIAGSKTKPFDYDLVFQEEYEALFDSELRDKIAHNNAFQRLKKSINQKIDSKADFIYETNFDHTPMHWPKLFLEKGYDIHLYYFCLNSISEAKKRVQIRVENGGHFVPYQEIERRFNMGYRNFSHHWRKFNLILLFDSSGHKETPKLFGIGKNENIRIIAPPHKPILQLLNL